MNRFSKSIIIGMAVLGLFGTVNLSQVNSHSVNARRIHRVVRHRQYRWHNGMPKVLQGNWIQSPMRMTRYQRKHRLSPKSVYQGLDFNNYHHAYQQTNVEFDKHKKLNTDWGSVGSEDVRYTYAHDRYIILREAQELHRYSLRNELYGGKYQKDMYEQPFYSKNNNYLVIKMQGKKHFRLWNVKKNKSHYLGYYSRYNHHLSDFNGLW